MNAQFPHIILLIAAIGLWLYASFPMLRYLVDATEGRYKWQLALWFIIMVAAIFLMKFSLYSLVGWPSPGTWMSRLFLGIALFTSYLVPFAKEYLARMFRK
jgi:NADH:ubiquinone oxidoreductase subunit 6 (subunit J)